MQIVMLICTPAECPMYLQLANGTADAEQPDEKPRLSRAAVEIRLEPVDAVLIECRKHSLHSSL